MAAAHGMPSKHVSASGVKDISQFRQNSFVTSQPGLPCGLRLLRTVAKNSGLRDPITTRVGDCVWRDYGSYTDKLRKRDFSCQCCCLVEKNSAKSGSRLRLRLEVSSFPAISGGLLGLKSTYGEVSSSAIFHTKSWGRNGSQSTRLRAKLGGDVDVDINGDVVAEDYYSVLGLTPDASPEEIKKAYYACMKTCHPDLSGNGAFITNFCSFVNEIYEVLSDPEQRLIYDAINGYSLTAINPFEDIYAEKDHAFVDEFTCIGCKNCAHTAPDSFEIEEEYGRARVICQSGNPVLVERAIKTCPVDCIYWTSAQQLTLLEDEMRRIERVNVGLMLAGMGGRGPNVFTQASWRWQKRQSRAVERARVRLMKEGGKNANEIWWKVNWGSAADEMSSKKAADKYSRERAGKAAAAARRWREYSRRGEDRRAIRTLAAARSAEAEKEADKEKAGIN